jgi:hypothetical protein
MPEEKQNAQSGLAEKFTGEVTRSLLLDQADKEFWLREAGTLPQAVLGRVYENISSHNRIVDDYVDEALKEDQTIIPELKKKVQNLKKQIAGFKEAQEGGAEMAEKLLMEEIQKLN